MIRSSNLTRELTYLHLVLSHLAFLGSLSKRILPFLLGNRKSIQEVAGSFTRYLHS